MNSYILDIVSKYTNTQFWAAIKMLHNCTLRSFDIKNVETGSSKHIKTLINDAHRYANDVHGT